MTELKVKCLFLLWWNSSKHTNIYFCKVNSNTLNLHKLSTYGIYFLQLLLVIGELMIESWKMDPPINLWFFDWLVTNFWYMGLSWSNTQCGPPADHLNNWYSSVTHISCFFFWLARHINWIIGNFPTQIVYLFVYLGFYVAFNTVQVISRRVVGRAEETSTYSSLGFCTVNCRPTASNYQLSHLRPWRGSNPSRRGGRRECYHSATVAPTQIV